MNSLTTVVFDVENKQKHKKTNFFFAITVLDYPTALAQGHKFDGQKRARGWPARVKGHSIELPIIFVK